MDDPRTRFPERECRPEDIEALLLIEADAGKAAWTPAMFKQLLGRKNARFRVLTTEDAPETAIAFYVLQVKGEEIYLANLAVASEWRRQSVATHALAKITDWSRQRGFRRIELHVQEENLAAQLLYKKNGFLAVDIIHRHYPGQDGYAMRKVL